MAEHTCKPGGPFDWTCSACRAHLVAADDAADYFAPPEEQRTLIQCAEESMGAGWVETLPQPAAPPLYTPSESGPVPGSPDDEECRRKAEESLRSMRKPGE